MLEEIVLCQNNVVGEVLCDIFGIVFSIGLVVNNGNGGVLFVDFCGFGFNCNVVLFDGNCIVFLGLVGCVDFNNILFVLIDCVDVLIGGVLMIYGVDVILGVVNFIMKCDFLGVEILVGEKIIEKGDGNYFCIDVIIGGNFDEGKGNVVLLIGYQELDFVYQGDCDFLVNNISLFLGMFGGLGMIVLLCVIGMCLIDFLIGQLSINLVVFNGGMCQINYGCVGVVGGGVDGLVMVGNYVLFNFNFYNIF